MNLDAISSIHELAAALDLSKKYWFDRDRTIKSLCLLVANNNDVIEMFGRSPIMLMSKDRQCVHIDDVVWDKLLHYGVVTITHWVANNRRPQTAGIKVSHRRKTVRIKVHPRIYQLCIVHMIESELLGKA